MDIPEADPITIRHRSDRWLIGAALFAAAATFWVYSPCLDHGFLHWDDEETVVENTLYRGLGLRQLKWMFTTTYMGPYQPLSWLSLAVDHQLWGMDPIGYHLTNIAIHAVNAALVVLLAAALFRAFRQRVGRDGPLPPSPIMGPATEPVTAVAAFVAALVWAIHPQRVESVAWVTERRDVLCGLFYLLCLLSYLRGHRLGRASRSGARWDWTAQVCGLLAVLSKGTAVSLPLVLLIIDVYPLRRLHGSVRSWLRPPQRGVIVEKWRYAVFSVLGIGIGFWGQWQGGAVQSLASVGPLDRLALTAYALMFYLGKLLLPVGLSPMYARPPVLNLASLRFLLPMGATVAMTAVAIRLRRRLPVILAAWTSYVVMLLPVSGLVTIGHELVADRYSYLPSIALIVAAGGVVMEGWGRLRSGVVRSMVGVTVPVILAVLVIQTRVLIPIWRDDLSLWRRAVAVNPDTPRAQTNLGGAYAMCGQYKEALAALTKAIEEDPQDVKAHQNLGVVLLDLGRPRDALNAFNEAIRIDPNYVRAREFRGTCLTELGRLDEALRALTDAIKLFPTSPGLKFRLAQAYSKKKDYGRAIATYEALIAEGQQRPDVYAALVETLLLDGRSDRAEAVLLSAPKHLRDTEPLRYSMVRLRSCQGRIAEALEVLGDVLRRWPDLRSRARLDPLLVTVRKDKRFDRLLAEVDAELLRSHIPPGASGP
jgi:tetratricopeptide (TPR) repeat protein